MNTRLYELQLLYSNRAGNGIGFSKGEMEVGKGMEADRAMAMAKTALEELDEHLSKMVTAERLGTKAFVTCFYRVCGLLCRCRSVSRG